MEMSNILISDPPATPKLTPAGRVSIYTTRPRKGHKPIVRLTCEKCRQRKIKCDKLSPCTNCQRLGIECGLVERARLPRGRYRGAAEKPSESVTDLWARVTQLEHQMESLVPERSNTPAVVAVSSPEDKTPLRQSPFSPSHHGSPEEDYMQTDRPKKKPRMLYEGPDDPNIANLPKPDLHPFIFKDDQTMSSLSQTSSSPVAWIGEYATTQIKDQLLDIFFVQVDPVFKIIHRPSLSGYLREGKPYLDYHNRHPAVEALTYAVYYAATCSLTDAQCMVIFESSKPPIVSRYRLACETALGNADFVTSEDLTVLQAFIIWLISTRSHDRSRRVWTMFSVALRVAQSLSLNMDPPTAPTRPFELEMRRRLRFAIGLLDTQVAFDRASTPIVPFSWMQSKPPTNLNDTTLTFTSPSTPPESPTFTDTTFAVLLSRAQGVTRLLEASAELGITSLNRRQKYVDDFRATASKLLVTCSPDTIPFHWFAVQVSECIASSLQLAAVRPLHKHPDYDPSHSRAPEGYSILRVAVDVLTKCQVAVKDPRGEPWRWFARIFTPWHALAVAAAELCLCERVEVVEEYWWSVELAYHDFVGFAADIRQEMPWRPIVRLMERAWERRRVLALKEKEKKRVQLAAAGGQDPVGAKMGVAGGNSVLPLESTDRWSGAWRMMDVGDADFEALRSTAWANWESFLDEMEIGESSWGQAL
ncbi:hypothetical protein BDV23DRAFT_194320 [Aspergillus alliaceus]|uniref:Zn(2)-C6 fungal-type domain-containing protein n=1 Tax=Petromyces alliaceus TaxID=209559 RepID=A0A5N7C6C2_PETAA|nr:hypothetical protein BDV23DRAFT_194320 [Aspergillus alliaceus]